MKTLLCCLLSTSGVVTGWFVEKEITGFANQPVEIPLTWEEKDTEGKFQYIGGPRVAHVQRHFSPR